LLNKTAQYSKKNNIIGTSLSNLKELVCQFALAGKNILLIGASGTGKELFAELYKKKSGRKNFAPVNCSGISDTILGSELFGHKKGSFTDAHKDRPGILSKYGKDGVIFLDEIGDASTSFQAAILRVLQTGDFKPVGSDTFENIGKLNELRIIAATSKTENLREELSYRFHRFYIPDLYDRKDDIPELIKHICNELEIKYISRMALNYLNDGWFWPGNIRELKTVLEQASILCKNNNDDTIRCDHLNSIYFDLTKDLSKKMAVNKLRIKSKPLESSYFLKNSTPPKSTIRLSLEEINALATIDDKEWGSVEESLLGRERDKLIISILKAIKPKRDVLLNLLSKHLSSEITFENTTPAEWDKLFWKHHAKQNRGGAEIERLFKGRINNRTASYNLRKLKKKFK
jgi:DNA-binding NtrC family response regulator